MPGESTLFDLSFLEQLQDNEFLVEAVGMYIHETSADLGLMQEAVDSGEIATAGKIAHKLKSSTGLLQAHLLFSTLETIEKSADEVAAAILLGSLVEKCRLQFSTLKTALEDYLDNIAKNHLDSAERV